MGSCILGKADLNPLVFHIKVNLLKKKQKKIKSKPAKHIQKLHRDSKENPGFGHVDILR